MDYTQYDREELRRLLLDRKLPIPRLIRSTRGATLESLYIERLKAADHRSRCWFLEITPELRNLIYERLLTRSCSNERRHPNILATCTQIWDEGTNILYGSADIVIYQVYARVYDQRHRIEGHRCFPQWPVALHRAREVRFWINDCESPAYVEKYFYSLCQFLSRPDRVIRKLRVQCVDDSSLQPMASVNLFAARLLERRGFALEVVGFAAPRPVFEDFAEGGRRNASSLQEARAHVIRMSKRFSAVETVDGPTVLVVRNTMGRWPTAVWEAILDDLAWVNKLHDDDPQYDQELIRKGWSWWERIAVVLSWTSNMPSWPQGEDSEMRLLHHAFIEFQAMKQTPATLQAHARSARVDGVSPTGGANVASDVSAPARPSDRSLAPW